ncbi:MAG: ABC transporter ATP-binding protein, partial [Chloroflexi bacterium]
MGIFRGLDADSYDRQYSDTYLAKRIVNYFSHYKRQLITIALAMVILALVSSLRPILVSMGVDDLDNGIDVANWVIIALFIVAITEYISNWVRRELLVKVVSSVVARLRKDAFNAAVERDLAFYDTHKSGKIVSRITSDTQEFGDVIIFTSDVFSQLISVVLLIVVLLNQSVLLTVILLLSMPLIMGAAMAFRSIARKVTRQGSRAMAMVNDTIQETVSGISVAKNFRKEAMIYDEFTEVNNRSFRINMMRGFVLSAVFPVLNVLSGIAIAVVTYLGATLVLGGTLAVGTWYLFVQGIDRFLFPFINLAAFWSQFQQGLSAIERVFALIDADNTIIQNDNQPADNIQGHIQFKNVTFEYVDNQPILKDFSLDIAPGESIAFVGHTGAGKSTIAKLIARFYEFQRGEILIDGQDIRSFNLQSYRSRLGIVPQQPFLFSGTIIDNIRYSKPNATDKEIEEIAHSIGNGEWLETLPDGLYSDVGERGARLSMGQRQLVSLMRVILQKPAIFILDEATASIDPFTEMQIQEALDLILSQSTSILIAHRLSTVRSADRIIVLKNGEIIEEGNHDSLLQQGGHYAEL